MFNFILFSVIYNEASNYSGIFNPMNDGYPINSEEIINYIYDYEYIRY